MNLRNILDPGNLLEYDVIGLSIIVFIRIEEIATRVGSYCVEDYVVSFIASWLVFRGISPVWFELFIVSRLLLLLELDYV